MKIGDNARVEDVYADTVEMGERVRAGNVYARFARFESHCRISGVASGGSDQEVSC